MDFIIAAVYKFFSVQQPQQLIRQLRELLGSQQILGTIIVASEGLNGTICGSREAIDCFKQFLQQQEILAGSEYKEASYHKQVFRKLKVKLKPEIVTLKMPVNPAKMVGQYVDPKDWNALIQDQNTIVIDTRNDYEYKIGTFPNAVNPKTQKFSELQTFVAEQLAGKKDATIAMMCTGGVRCEKSTSLLLQQGFKRVFHLKGGILNYLATIPAQQNLWQGECYVFDQRVSVGLGLVKGQAQLCFDCGDVFLPDKQVTLHANCSKIAVTSQ